QGAVRKPDALDAKLAADGVDELLGLVAHRKGSRSSDTASVHLHCTDVEGEWLVRMEPGAMIVDRVHAKGDAALRGAASDLDLFVWGRIAATPLEVIGDVAAVDRLRALRTA